MNRYTRHNLVRDAILRTLRRHGITVSSEPNVGYGKRADLAILLPKETLYVDVCIVTPFVANAESNPAKAILTAEQTKTTLYEPFNINCIPFVMDYFGAAGELAEKLVRTVQHTFELGASFAKELIDAVSSAVHRGNGVMARSAMSTR